MNPRFRNFWRSSDVLLVAFLFGLVVAIFVATRNYPSIPWEDGGSPAFFPLILAVLLAGLGCAAACEGLLHPHPLSRPPKAGALRVIAALVVLAAAPILLGYLGFRATSALLGLVMMCIFVDWGGMTLTKGAIMVATAIGVAILLGFGFEDLAGRRLPKSALF